MASGAYSRGVGIPNRQPRTTNSAERGRLPFHVGRWRIDPASREASDGVAVRRLSPRALRVLIALAYAHGHVVTRGELLDFVWPDVHVGDESLTQAVAELRRAFGDRRDIGRMIETVAKSGYRLRAPVLTDVSAGDAPDAWAEVTPSAAPSPLPLDAYLAVLEARWLARHDGYLAASAIDVLLSNAVSAAPGAASVQIDYAVLTALAALHHETYRHRLPAADAAARRAVASRPDLAASHRARGFVAGAAGQVELARSAFEQAFTLDPQDGDTHYYAAQTFFGLGHVRATAVLAERAASLMPDDYRPAFFVARAAWNLGERSRAEAAARSALRRLEVEREATPRSRRLLSARGALRAMLGARDEVATAAAAQRPLGARYFYDVITLAHSGELDLALDALEAMIDGGWRYGGWLRADPVNELLSHEERYRRLTHQLLAA